jgi:hypothetical protein
MSYSIFVVSQPVVVFSWLVSIETVGNQYSQVPEVLYFMSSISSKDTGNVS